MVTWCQVLFTLYLSRRSTFYLMNIILPCTLLSAPYTAVHTPLHAVFNTLRLRHVIQDGGPKIETVQNRASIATVHAAVHRRARCCPC